MPKNKLHLLSALQIERLSHSDNDQMFNDGGGLYLFVRHYGEKEWIFRYTSPITKQRRKQSLGSFKDTNLKQARVLASQKRTLLESGLDPLIEADKQLQKETKELAERKRQQSHTVRNVFESWKQNELQNRKDKGCEINRAFEKDVFPLIGNTPINEVTRQEIRSILERLTNRKAKSMANRLLANLKQFFAYAEDEELINLDPTRRLTKDRVGGKEKSRKRYLEEQELVLLKDLLPQSGLRTEYEALIWFLLSTGCRVNEVLRAKWEHFDISRRMFVIPSEHAKNTFKHEVYLSRFALKQLIMLKKTRTTQYLVPNRKSDGPITRQVLTKQVTDRQQESSKKNRVHNPQALVLPKGRWVIHDLRRTAGTIMQELGIMPHIIKKCLNQKIEDKIIETYQRASLIHEQKEAFEKLGQYLLAIGQKKK
ncbi:integrase arm-type DNA-binding domain-containing protein [Emticicia sp. BO119]|uniref:tyrosine-type recombinase/integrase n=1 Tax=Emticicia sp. BO119 TaxID=2757768 RepID=UPI0015F083C8|nr:integrase arm-type DNA-binding domain-containing protein [Emticicia sp. BO119]MBA4853768.1 tyrosine-type recombinase/integrase [Emticicia sp. BO119]